MSVRRMVRRDPRRGAAREVWMVDVVFEHADGRVERIRKVSPVQTRRGAEEYERQLRGALLEPRTASRKEVPLVRDFAGEFLDVYATTENKASEVEAKRSVLRNHIEPAFGHLRLDAITAEGIARYKAEKLRADYSRKSINNQLGVLRRLLAVAVEWGRIEHVPVAKWLMRLPPPTFDFFSFEEAERLVAAADAIWRPMIVVALRTGMRIGELVALRWQDVDLVAGKVVVRQALSGKKIDLPKNNRTREIPLSDEASRTLRGHRHLRGEFVFSDAHGGMLTRYACKWPLWSACKRAGLRLIGWHSLRHTFASHLVMRGVPLKAVQELLGHADVAMTMRYAHLSADVRRDAVSLLDRPACLLDRPAYGNLTATGAAGR